MKFHENPSSGNGVVPREWTDEQTDKDSLFAILRILLEIFCIGE